MLWKKFSMYARTFAPVYWSRITLNEGRVRKISVWFFRVCDHSSIQSHTRTPFLDLWAVRGNRIWDFVRYFSFTIFSMWISSL